MTQLEQPAVPLSSASVFRDNSMISGYKTCPRYYQLRYKLHWRSQGVSMPLSFGLAWHAGQDIVWTHAKTQPQRALAELATAAFEESWAADGLPAEPSVDEIDKFGARTPGVAHEMYENYIEHRWKILQECELLACEQPFAVPMPGFTDVWYAGRLDKVIKYQAEALVVEHKTTTKYKKEGGFRSTYVTSWFNDSQVKGYQFGGSLYYENLSQVWVDAALVHKQVHNAFRFIPIAHQFPLLAEWVHDTGDWIRRIEADEQRNYFPKNEGSCVGKYGACSFLNICRTTADPSSLTEVPEGYVVEEWKPFDILKLDKLLKGAK